MKFFFFSSFDISCMIQENEQSSSQTGRKRDVHKNNTNKRQKAVGAKQSRK